MTLFCSISLILALHCLFKHLNLIFTKYLWYSSPFRGTSLDFYLSFITDKVVPHDQQNILAKCFFDIMSCFWPLASFVTSFSPISLIFNLNFTKIFMNSKLVQHDHMKNFGKKLYHVLFLTEDVISDIILLYFTNFTTSSPVL